MSGSNGWTDLIPPDWVRKKLKYVASLKSGESITSDEITDSGPYPVFGGNGLRGYTTEYTHCGKYVLIGRQGALCGNINYASGCFWASEHAVVVEIKDGSEPIWLGELLRAMNLNQYSQSAAQPGLAVDVIANLEIPVPPIEEQRSISVYLDRETARIDGLIAKKRRLIELLHEKRQAVVSRTVTKGLDPGAPMKDSGIEWLGQIPAEWAARRLGGVTSKITNGYVGPTRDILKTEGVKYLQSLHIKENSILFNNDYFVDEEWSKRHSKSILKRGDVLIVQTGDIGQVAVVTSEFEGANCHALIVASPVKEAICGEYLAWVLCSNYGFHALKSIQTGALHPHLNCGNVKDVWLPLPPMAAQRAIVAHVDRTVVEHNRAAQMAEKAIGVLDEHRTSLIAAAVTGKIDVRAHPADAVEVAD